MISVPLSLFLCELVPGERSTTREAPNVSSKHKQDRPRLISDLFQAVANRDRALPIQVARNLRTSLTLSRKPRFSRIKTSKLSRLGWRGQYLNHSMKLSRCYSCCIDGSMLYTCRAASISDARALNVFEAWGGKGLRRAPTSTSNGTAQEVLSFPVASVAAVNRREAAILQSETDQTIREALMQTTRVAKLGALEVHRHLSLARFGKVLCLLESDTAGASCRYMGPA